MIQENTSTPTSGINEEKMNHYREKLRMEQSLLMGLLAGATACLVSAFIWAVITVSTGYQIGYMAIGVGLLVGFAVRLMGKGIDQIFGIMGAILALLGCVLGNFFSLVAILASQMNMGYFDVFSMLSMDMVSELMQETFNIMDLLFYGIAIYEGYKFSFREITYEEVSMNAA